MVAIGVVNVPIFARLLRGSIIWMAARRRASPLNLFSHELSAAARDVGPELIAGPSARPRRR